MRIFEKLLAIAVVFSGLLLLASLWGDAPARAAGVCLILLGGAMLAKFFSRSI